MFRKGGDVAFLTEELKAVFDPRGGYWQPGGKFMPSIVAELGYVVERHLQTIGLMQKPGMDDTQRLLVESKRKEWEQRNKQQDAFAESNYPEGAQLCIKCNTAARRHDGRLHDLPRLRRLEVRLTASDAFLSRASRVPARRLLTTGAARDLPGGLRAAFFPGAKSRLEASWPLARSVRSCARYSSRLRAPPAARPSASTKGRRCRQSERAIVRADPVVSAGLPVQLRLRQVDGREVGLSASAVELRAGRARLLVDCRVAESGSVHRFTVDGELEPGRALPACRERLGAKL